MWHIRKMEYDLAIKQNEVLVSAATWIYWVERCPAPPRPPKKMHPCPHSRKLWVWPSLGKGFLQITWGSWDEIILHYLAVSKFNDVSLQETQRKDREKRRKPCEDRQRLDWCLTSQEVPRTTETGRGKEGSYTRCFGGSMALQTPRFWTTGL